MPLLTKSRLILLKNCRLHNNVFSKSKPSAILSTNNNTYSTSPQKIKFSKEEIEQRLEYANEQRKEYKKQVSELRKQYKNEIFTTRQEEERVKAKISSKQAIEVAQRRKIKLLKAIETERKQHVIQEARRETFEEHLKEVQVHRDARKGRYEEARKLVVEELEAESHLWMTTAEEIDKVFDDQNVMQELWTNPYTIGARPKDAEYWRFQSHTADMGRSYAKRRELLLGEVLNDVFVDENVDRNYWTNEKLDELFQQEQRVKLHAMLRLEGRRRLLLKQRELMKEHFTLAPNQKEAGVPLKLPPPDLEVLADERMMEEEGLKALFDNPELFLHITDGKVQAVKDEFSELPDGTPYPVFIANDTHVVKPKEKKKIIKSKQQQKETPSSDKSQESESVEEYMDEESPEYLKNIESSTETNDDNILEDDEELLLREENRFTERDVNWVANKLQSKITYFEQLEARDSKSEASEQQALSQANSIGTRLPSAEEESQKEEDKRTQEMNLQEVIEIINTLTQKQQQALEDMSMEKLLVDPNVTMEYIISWVANITDGRFSGTRLNREQVKQIVEAEYVLSMDKDLANRLLEESEEMEKKHNDGLLVTKDEDEQIEDDVLDDAGIDTPQEIGDTTTTTTDNKEPK